MTDRTIKDYRPETKSLLARLTCAGFTIHSGSNGGDRFAFTGDMESFFEELMGTDEAHLYVIAPGTPFTPSEKTGKPIQKRHTLYLVFGNSPGELVCDYSVHPLLEEVIDAHADAWCDREQPTMTHAEAYGVRTAAEAQSHVAVECFQDA